MKSFRYIASVFGVAALVTAAIVTAQGASTVNPTVPASNSPLSSAPIRNNFQATYNDISGIETKFSGSIAPVNPSTYQDWMNTTSSTAPTWQVFVAGSWVQIGSFNCTSLPCTWSAGGSSVLAGGTLTANHLVIGSGGATINPLTAAGTTVQVLHGNASGVPAWGSVNLGTDVTSTLGIANGGTNCVTAGIGCINSISGQSYTGFSGTGNLIGDTSPTFHTGMTLAWLTSAGTQCAQISSAGALGGSGSPCSAPTVPLYTRLTGSGTFSLTGAPRQLYVKMCGGGGGGQGANGSSSLGSAGGTGPTATFASWTAIGGSGGASFTAPSGGSGGATGSGTLVFDAPGASGSAGSQYAPPNPSETEAVSPPGASSPMGGGGGGSVNNGGSNGGFCAGASGGNYADVMGGAGLQTVAGSGAAGEYKEFYVNSPSGTFSYAAATTGGTAGSGSSANGGVGGGAFILVEQLY